MDIELTEEQRQVQSLCRDFAEEELRPNARRWDAEHEFPREAVKKLGELGLLGVAVPAEWGGAGMDTVAYALAMEEISRGCAGTGVIMSVNNSLYCDPVLKYGDDAQKREFLAPFARGEKLGASRSPSPMSGSDAAEMRTTAVARGGRLRPRRLEELHHERPAGGRDPGLRHDRSGQGAPGHQRLPRAHRRGGLHPRQARREGRHPRLTARAASSSRTASSRSAIGSGKEGEGFKIAMSTLDGGRIGIAAQALGIARAAHEEAVAYAKDRKAFGQPIATFQAIQFMLADMATELDAARLLVWRAATLKDQGVRFSAEAAMAKLYASEMAERVTSKGLQIHGGLGYMKECHAERHWRDSRITEIYEGTSEIQRMVISAALLKA